MYVGQTLKSLNDRLKIHWKDSKKHKNRNRPLYRAMCAYGIGNFSIELLEDVCVENLDFKTTKAKTESKQNKKCNEMMHSLAYRKFVDIMESAVYRNKVNLIKVNPAWTRF